MLRAYKVENQRTEETATASKRRRRFVARPFILATLAAMAIYCNLSFFQRRLGALGQLPTMYTFYSRISDIPMPAGMSHEDHSRLLIFWQKAWRQAGWNAVVLDETDAMKHPDYQRLQPLVKKTGAGAYNQLCFLRWLALAQVGGGWMSDYDVFPLHDFRRDGRILPNNGTLTLHNRLCPSLVSGSGDEWTRVAEEMIDYAAENEINSDQKALAALFVDNSDLFEQDWSVTQKVFNASEWDVNDCGEQTPQSMRAVHFAHTPVKRALKEGKLPKEWSVRNRAEVATHFMEQWLRRCGARKIFVRDKRLLVASRGTANTQPMTAVKTPANTQKMNVVKAPANTQKMTAVKAPANTQRMTAAKVPANPQRMTAVKATARVTSSKLLLPRDNPTVR